MGLVGSQTAQTTIVTAIANATKRIDAAKREAEQTGIATSSGDTPPTVASQQDNYIIGAFDEFRMSASTPTTFTGFTGGVLGREITVTNVGSFNIVLAHQSGSSSAENRVISPTGSNLTLAPQQSARLRYDVVDSRWRIIYHSGS